MEIGLLSVSAICLNVRYKGLSKMLSWMNSWMPDAASTITINAIMNPNFLMPLDNKLPTIKKR
jgi:hypothetical protein